MTCRTSLASHLRRSLLALTPLILACGPHFYQAPPPLARYPERTAGKTWQDLLIESQPSSGEPHKQIIADTQQFFTDFAELDEAARQNGLKTLIERNRATRYQPAVGNLLIECRELLTQPSPGMERYLEDRAAALTLKLPQKPIRNWNQDDKEFQRLLDRYEQGLANRLRVSSALLADAPAGLRPNHQVRHAALLIRLGDLEEAHRTFQQTLIDHPTHPRAEVAAFMLGRCSLAITRAMPHLTPEEQRLQQDHYDLTASELANYLIAFPKGRFTDDAQGWLGAVAADRNQLGLAIDRQLERLNIQQTREVRSSTLRECDWLFERLFDQAVDQGFWDADYSDFGSLPDFDQLALHPDLTRLFLFHAVDPAYQVHLPLRGENDTGDRGTLRFLENQILRASPFARHSLQQLGLAIQESGRPLDTTSHLILGWAALRSDDPAQALALFDLGLTKDRTDELLHARAIALSRLERFRDSADAYILLDQKFPDSPLNAPSRFDHAIALHRAGEAGEALLILLDLSGFYDSELRPDPALSLRPEHEAIQWIDTLAQFAPIEELRRPLDRLPAGDPRTRVLRALVRSRALCLEDFVLAAKHLDEIDHPAFPIHRYGRRWSAQHHIHLTPGQWDELKTLRNTARALRLASPRDPGIASAHLRHARQWEALRGQVTLPLQGIFDYSQSETSKLDQLRRTNGRILGIPDQDIAAELDARDELSHALKHYLAAAEKSRHPDIAAPALFRANELLFKLAEFSPYRCSRAAETDATALSNQLVDRLETDFPKRPETAQAIRFTFIPPDLLGAWMPGNYNPANSDAAIAEALRAEAPAEPSELIDQRYEAIVATLHFLPHSEQTIEEIQRDLDLAQKEFLKIRTYLDSAQILRVVDDLDDLHAAAHMPRVTVEQLGEYAALRLSGSRPSDLPDANSPLISFYRFLALFRPLPSGPEATHQSPARWKAFIDAHPRSPKCEAASLRRARILVRHASPIPHVRAFHFPASPITAGYKQLHCQPNPEYLKPALDALHDHRIRFPAGRYQRDIQLLQAACDMITGEIPSALGALSEVIEDQEHPELLGDSALYFAGLIERLLEPSHRPALAAAIRQNPQALAQIERLAHGDTCIARIRPILPWLKGQP